MSAIAAVNPYKPGQRPPEIYDGPVDHTELREHVCERVLQRFGFLRRPEPSLETLNEIVKQWSRRVGYDNVQKRIYMHERHIGPFPVIEPNDFFATWLEHGTAGGCWPSGEAMYGLLHRIGFRVTRVAGTMPQVPDPMVPAHGGLNVDLDGRLYRVDPGLGAEAALELIEGVPTAHESQAHGLWSDGDMTVWWRPGHARTPLQVVIWLYGLSGAFFAYRNEATKRFSIFNNSLYIRKNVGGGILTYGRGNLVTVDAAGQLSSVPIEPKDVPELLVTRLGLSEAIAQRVPIEDHSGALFQ